ncbi:MAG: SsrA-binding protein SmpB [Clostridia bacterium]|nr:SsrA-binding protein SmpB [Clostridia bacterium]MBR2496519.1 SsrA-binding protein SmpB [Clostridia bacterium]
MKIIATNKSINFEYFVLDRFEAGIELIGCEVKSIRLGNVSLKESFIFVRNGQMTLKNMHVAPYDKGSFSNVEPRRDRKLLMHKKEINRLFGKIQEKGYTLVPDKIYLKGSLVKMEVALCKGKQSFDKKRTIKDRDQQREMEREIKNYK